VRQDTVLLPSQEVIDDYFVVVRPDVALVLALTANQEIVFVRQYRHGIGEILLELSAGTFDPNTESPEVAAQRELQEETGYSAPHLLKLATLYDNPVKDTNRIHLFVAQNAFISGEQKLDVTEAIEVVLIPIEKVSEKILKGEICVSGTIAALCLGLQFLNFSQ
jgi:8-oxo-dGTP pyrophosphatase MutT (NUDIX family)